MPKRWGNRSPSKMNLQKGFGVKGLQKKIIRNIISTPTQMIQPAQEKFDDINTFYVDSGSDEESSSDSEEEKEDV